MTECGGVGMCVWQGVGVVDRNLTLTRSGCWHEGDIAGNKCTRLLHAHNRKLATAPLFHSGTPWRGERELPSQTRPRACARHGVPRPTYIFTLIHVNAITCHCHYNLFIAVNESILSTKASCQRQLPVSASFLSAAHYAHCHAKQRQRGEFPSPLSKNASKMYHQ